ncbi:MAG TPA: hypothetical protein VMS21_02440, partial [Methylomirabilota bacterium]|nr:hypothetical protein [Methylomirabilota bacterium]
MADPRVEPASPGRAEDRPAISFAILGLCLLAVLAILFAESFERGKVLFSNDRTLGLISSEADQLPGTFFGYWADLNWVGYAMPSAAPDINYAVNSILTPVQFLKFFPPFSLFFLGLSAGLCFRQLGFGPLVCVLGGLAAALNSNVFSNVCWGQTSRALCMGTSFLALAALHTRPVKWGWLSPLVAGLAVGMGVMDGLDVGALFSLCIAAYVLFHSWTWEGALRRRLVVGAGKVAIIAVFAALTAAHGLSTMIQTQVQGVSGMEQDEESRERRWVQATVWSLPKIETLRVIIPGLFGYRMDSEGRNYWGAVGQVPEVKTSRSSGAGEYAGVLVVLIALWGAAQALRGNAGGYALRERRWIGFWCGVALISVLLAWGRHAPFYQFVYALPYFSTIRNPIKFMHVFHFALLILFGYGLHHLVRHHLGAAAGKTASIGGQLKLWRAERTFGKRWTVGCLIVAGVSALGWVMMMASHEKWAAHIQELGFPTSLAGEIARSSIGEVGWFVVWLLLGVVAMTLVFSGALAGGRVRWAGILLGLLLVVDLGRANLPWIIYQNHIRKYATNPVLDVLREAPYEARVTL